ncbi:MAG: NADH-quinone oxidoreductase subunit N [Vicinamibacterales bacterium]
MSLASIAAIVPVLCVAAAGIAALLAEALRQPGERMPIAGLGAIGLAGAGVSAVQLWSRNSSSMGVVADNFGLFVTLVLVVIGLLTMAFSSQTVGRDRLPTGEYYSLTLFSISGMILMATASDLLLVFLALEVLSISVYVLTAIRRSEESSSEGGFKYFLLGSFSSAIFLYGIAFAYGMAGSTKLDAIGSVLAAEAMDLSPLAFVAMVLLLVGFAFKVSAVPFHMWTPDAYEGAPAIVSGFMSTGVKAAAFAALVRVFLSAFEPMQAHWAPAVWAVSMLTMVAGTIIAVVQTNLKRLLAYSSIAHAGYMLVGVVAANDTGKAAVLFYLLAYGVANLAVFAVLALLSRAGEPRDEVRHYAGLWQSHPAVAGLMTALLLSLGGIPLTAGFVAKWYVFNAAVEANYYGLAIVGVLTTVVSIFFYLRIVVMMYMAQPGGEAAPRLSAFSMATLALSVLLVFYLGMFPARVLALASDSVGSIF